MRYFEYRSQRIDTDAYDLTKVLNKWGAEGWEVISVFCPDHRNWSTFVATAKREIISQRTPALGRKFR